MRDNFTRILRTFVATLLLAAATFAHAAFQFEQVYSNEDGAVQYIVLHETAGADRQQALRGLTLTSTHAGVAKTYVFTNDLPSSQTAGKRVLIATQGFAALGLVIPDYVIPNEFIATDAATLSFDASDQFGYPLLPTDGINALARSGAVTPNAATNFTGATASARALPVTAVEYYNPALDHYFMSALQADIEIIG